jgi:hypothetical protein
MVMFGNDVGKCTISGPDGSRVAAGLPAFAGAISPSLQFPCTHVDADQDLPPRVVRLHVHATGGGGITHGGAREWGAGGGDG